MRSHRPPFQEIAFQAPYLLIQQVVGLVNQADDHISPHFSRMDRDHISAFFISFGHMHHPHKKISLAPPSLHPAIIRPVAFRDRSFLVPVDCLFSWSEYGDNSIHHHRYLRLFKVARNALHKRAVALSHAGILSAVCFDLAV